MTARGGAALRASRLCRAYALSRSTDIAGAGSAPTEWNGWEEAEEEYHPSVEEEAELDARIEAEHAAEAAARTAAFAAWEAKERRSRRWGATDAGVARPWTVAEKELLAFLVAAGEYKVPLSENSWNCPYRTMAVGDIPVPQGASKRETLRRLVARGHVKQFLGDTAAGRPYRYGAANLWARFVLCVVSDDDVVRDEEIAAAARGRAAFQAWLATRSGTCVRGAAT